MSGKPLSLSAWLAPNWEAALKSLGSNASKLSRVYPLWYSLADEGLARRRADLSADSRKRVLASGVEAWPSVSPGDSGQVTRMLLDEKCAEFHARGLVALALEDSAKGLMLDYGPVPPSQEEALQSFVARLHAACADAGLKLGMVAPSNAQGLAGYLEILQLRLADFHGSFTGPGAIAPVDWAAAALKKAGLLVPPENIEFGFPAFGYDWAEKRVSMLDYPAWDALVAKHGPAQRDVASGELVLNFEGHQAWFCDSIAALRKLLQAREAGVDQAAFWALGTEDPRLWDMLEDFPVPFAKVGHGL